MRKRRASGTTKDIGRDALTELALDCRWSWHHGTDQLWSELDLELWALTRNPWGPAPARVEELLTRPAVQARVERLLAQRRDYRVAIPRIRRPDIHGPWPHGARAGEHPEQ